MNNFNEFCKFLNVTPDERMKLAQHLATLRHAATMKLAEPPIDGVAPVEAPSKADSRKPWEKSSWTCAKATVTNRGLQCPPPGERCPDCPAGVEGPEHG
jgi:hypothetical protein